MDLNNGFNGSRDINESTISTQVITKALSSILNNQLSVNSTAKHSSIGFNVFCIVLSCLVIFGMIGYCFYLVYVQNSVKFIDYKIERKKMNAYLFYFQ